MSKHFMLLPCLFTFLFSCFSFAQTGPRVYGDIKLTSDYNEKGLTQTDHGLAIIAGMGYLFNSQGRMGLQASNVKYQSYSSTVRADFFADYKFIFTPNADLKLKTAYNYYSPAAGRNNLLTGLDQNLFNYHFLLEHDDNFDGTTGRRDWFAFHKDWNFNTYLVSMTIGYSMLQQTSLKNYFDTRIGISYIGQQFYAGLFHCYNSQSSQFSGQGDMAFLVEAGVKF